jgi:hypothetical protein
MSSSIDEGLSHCAEEKIFRMFSDKADQSQGLGLYAEDMTYS